MQTKRVLAGVLTSTLLLGACPAALAADYNDSSLTGGSAAWQAWTEGWAALAADYTQVSLTPGADETQLNFAWYSKDADGAATRSCTSARTATTSLRLRARPRRWIPA